MPSRSATSDHVEALGTLEVGVIGWIGTTVGVVALNGTTAGLAALVWHRAFGDRAARMAAAGHGIV